MHTCILYYLKKKCGCDYTEKIDGIGPGTAYKFILEHKNIENILQEIKRLNEEKVNSK